MCSFIISYQTHEIDSVIHEHLPSNKRGTFFRKYTSDGLLTILYFSAASGWLIFTISTPIKHKESSLCISTMYKEMLTLTFSWAYNRVIALNCEIRCLFMLSMWTIWQGAESLQTNYSACNYLLLCKKLWLSDKTKISRVFLLKPHFIEFYHDNIQKKIVHKDTSWRDFKCLTK